MKESIKTYSTADILHISGAALVRIIPQCLVNNYTAAHFLLAKLKRINSKKYTTNRPQQLVVMWEVMKVWIGNVNEIDFNSSYKNEMNYLLEVFELPILTVSEATTLFALENQVYKNCEGLPEIISSYGLDLNKEVIINLIKGIING
jgi:hypothetical protein